MLGICSLSKVGRRCDGVESHCVEIRDMHFVAGLLECLHGKEICDRYPREDGAQALP